LAGNLTYCEVLFFHGSSEAFNNVEGTHKERWLPGIRYYKFEGTKNLEEKTQKCLGFGVWYPPGSYRQIFSVSSMASTLKS
jgi:hypothetical protein